MKKKIIMSAFNVHTGGGFTLLKELFNISNPKEYYFKVILDHRTKSSFLKMKMKKQFIKRKIISRLYYFLINTYYGQKNFVTFCFNGLPPFFRNENKVISYVQTFYFTGNPKDYKFPLFVRLRILCEKLWFWTFYNNIDEIWVQTKHIKRTLVNVIKKKSLKQKKIRIIPFVSSNIKKKLNSKKNINININNFNKKIFFYPSDFSAHKNHINLVRGFGIFQLEYPLSKLYLTLSDAQFSDLKQILIKRYIPLNGIINLGKLSHEEVLNMYKSSILVFPSFDETFGLPLIEASSIGTPIVASNKAFVREICHNAHLFDPRSATGIADKLKKSVIKIRKTKCIYKTTEINDGKSFIKLLVN